MVNYSENWQYMVDDSKVHIWKKHDDDLWRTIKDCRKTLSERKYVMKSEFIAKVDWNQKIFEKKNCIRKMSVLLKSISKDRFAFAQLL